MGQIASPRLQNDAQVAKAFTSIPTQQEDDVKSFVSAVVVAAVLAIGSAWTLSLFQRTAETEFHTVGARP